MQSYIFVLQGGFMGRPLRNEGPDVLYRVTSGGNADDKIFRDDNDRLLLLNINLGHRAVSLGLPWPLP